MVSAYHRIVQNAVFSLGEEWKKQKKVKKVYLGNKHPLSIVEPNSKSVVNYQPDVYFILRNNKKLIFEVLDSEEKKQDIIIADIIRTFLLENVEALIFINPGSSSDEKTILEALKTIYKGLVDKGVSPNDLPNDKKTGPYSIKREEARSEEAALEKLKSYFN